MPLLARRLLPAVLALILLVAACGGSDAGDETLGGGDGSDTADTGGDAALDASDTHENAGDGSGVSDHHGARSDHDHSHGEGGGHGTSGAPTRYDAEVADAVQTIVIDIVDGDLAGGVQRVSVEHGSVVALMVTSDVAEEVHVHGYDILRAVSDGHPAHFAFNAEIPGVFEVEFEGSGRLLMQLEIS